MTGWLGGGGKRAVIASASFTEPYVLSRALLRDPEHVFPPYDAILLPPNGLGSRRR